MLSLKENFFFKNKISLFVALVAVAVTVFIVRQIVLNSITLPYNCNGIEQRTVKIPSAQGNNELKDTVIQLSYECNVILLNPNIGTTAYTQRLRAVLDSLNFRLEETCICPDKLERWLYNGPGDVDAVGIVRDPPPGTNGIGLGLNYTLPDSPNNPAFNGSFSNANANPTDPTSPVVKVAIVDTGVDITQPNPSLGFPDPQAYLLPFLWPNTAQPCNIPPARYGVNVLDGSPPTDINGHGTHINGIVAGLPPQAVSNLVTASNGSSKRVRLEILNAKFTTGATASGNLFQAICALHYALKQQAEVINISWGYLSDSLPRMMKPFLKEAMDSNVVIVAGLGNDGKLFRGPVGTLRFWPAGFSESLDNVISVGASDNAGKMASFSNHGEPSNFDIMTVVAPGVDILSTFPKYLQASPQKGLALGSGTSMATPFVTRTVAMMIGKKKLEGAAHSPASIKTAMKDNANPSRAANNFTFKPENVVAATF